MSFYNASSMTGGTNPSWMNERNPPNSNNVNPNIPEWVNSENPPGKKKTSFSSTDLSLICLGIFGGCFFGCRSSITKDLFNTVKTTPFRDLSLNRAADGLVNQLGQLKTDANAAASVTSFALAGGTAINHHIQSVYNDDRKDSFQKITAIALPCLKKAALLSIGLFIGYSAGRFSKS